MENNMATYKHVLNTTIEIGLYGQTLKPGHVLLNNTKQEKHLDFYPIILGHGVIDSVPGFVVKVIKIVTDADRVKTLRAEKKELNKRIKELEKRLDKDTLVK